MAAVHAYVYIIHMKREELERRLRKAGAKFVRHGGKHDIWVGANGAEDAVPRHNELNEITARKILRTIGGDTTGGQRK